MSADTGIDEDCRHPQLPILSVHGGSKGCCGLWWQCHLCSSWFLFLSPGKFWLRGFLLTRGLAYEPAHHDGFTGICWVVLWNSCEADVWSMNLFEGTTVLWFEVVMALLPTLVAPQCDTAKSMWVLDADVVARKAKSESAGVHRVRTALVSEQSLTLCDDWAGVQVASCSVTVLVTACKALRRQQAKNGSTENWPWGLEAAWFSMGWASTRLQEYTERSGFGIWSVN